MKTNTYTLIMAGGVGSRFWPKSRNHFPKQFIDILGTGESLLQLTYKRFLNVAQNENIFVLTNTSYADLVQKQLPDILTENILLEPSRNNTAPCIAYATYKILQQNPDANIVVAPSDHLILKENVFLNKIEQALQFTERNDALVTLGISPTRPDTGYGYIKFDNTESNSELKKVSAFMEKPNLDKAKEYLADGAYVWNAGIFIWSAKSLKNAFQKYASEIDEVFTKGDNLYNTNEEQQFIAEHYPTCPNISIDYAILEKADNIYTIPADIGWSDLGTWASLHEVAEKDEHKNVINVEKFDIKDTHNCIVHLPKNKVAVIRGLENFIIVDDGEVLMIYPKNEEQEIKKVSQNVVAKFGEIFS
ncbi:mannose-1-phosphate guanylyltransferase [Pedobacter sp. AW1-32]|uniref:mannose-1-phosphate guanylyltransferase n=1 Tax=Pedobacter sp. AW1-32 TaxID=3383026 RepID=UPI003FEF95FE